MAWLSVMNNQVPDLKEKRGVMRGVPLSCSTRVLACRPWTPATAYPTYFVCDKSELEVDSLSAAFINTLQTSCFHLPASASPVTSILTHERLALGRLWTYSSWRQQLNPKLRHSQRPSIGRARITAEPAASDATSKRPLFRWRPAFFNRQSGASKDDLQHCALFRRTDCSRCCRTR